MPETKTGQVRKQKKQQGSSGARQYLSSTLRNNRLLAQVRASTSSNSLFLAIVSVSLLGFGIALIVIFGSTDNKVSDLILIGSIMLVAGVIFIIMFIVSVYRTVAGRRKVSPGSERDLAHAEQSRQLESRNRPNSSVMGYVNCCDRNLVITPEDIERQRRPSAVSLYGNEGQVNEQNQDPVVSLPLPVVLPVTCDSGEVIEVPFATNTNYSEDDDVFEEQKHRDKTARGIRRAILGKEGSVPSSQSDVIDLTAPKQDGDETTNSLAVGTDKRDGVQNDDATAIQSKDHILELGSKILQKSDTDYVLKAADMEVDMDIDKLDVEAGNTASADVLTSLCSDVDDNDYTMTTSTKNHLGELGSKILQKHNADLTDTDYENKNAGKDEDVTVEVELRRVSGDFRTSESAHGNTAPDVSKTRFESTDGDVSDSNSDWAILTHDGQDSKC